MNLFWLKYVSYAFLAGAAYFYFVIRLKKLSLSLPVKTALYCVCIVLACVAWHVQEHNAQLYSPRQLVVGTVTAVTANHHKGGSIDYDFQLRPESGSLSQSFNTEISENQPIHPGDLVGVLYRTWDGAPVTIDEIQGQHPGWHHRRYDNGNAYIFGVSIAGILALITVLFATRNQQPQIPLADDHP